MAALPATLRNSEGTEAPRTAGAGVARGKGFALVRRVMRAATVRTESHLFAVSTRLEDAGGISIEQATRHMRALEAFLAACAAVGCESEFLAAAERARLGGMAEALLSSVRR